MRSLTSTSLTARTLLVAAAAVLLVGSGATPATAQTGPVTFTDHIRPIMERSCWNCHGEAAQLSDLDLSSRDGALAAASTGWWPDWTSRRCR